MAAHHSPTPQAYPASCTRTTVRRSAHASAARPRAVVYPHRRSPEQLGRFAQILAEVLAGERPARQVRSLLSRRAYELLARRAGAYACAQRPRVLNARLSAPAADIAELSAVVECGARCRALALRVAYVQHAWLCTHIETDLCRAAGR